MNSKSKIHFGDQTFKKIEKLGKKEFSGRFHPRQEGRTGYSASHRTAA
jgi:hypothetical protein